MLIQTVTMWEKYQNWFLKFLVVLKKGRSKIFFPPPGSVSIHVWFNRWEIVGSLHVCRKSTYGWTGVLTAVTSMGWSSMFVICVCGKSQLWWVVVAAGEPCLVLAGHCVEQIVAGLGQVSHKLVWRWWVGGGLCVSVLHRHRPCSAAQHT